MGLECQQAIGVGVECPTGCSEHGSCVNGFCECNAGWHGTACEIEGTPTTFLTVGSLFKAGLVRGRKGSKAAAKAACDVPSYHQAYARNSSQMNKLLRSLPEDEAQPWRCSSCALVSNAGSLVGQGHGEAIDAHACVWRMNRAPTVGFEADVGRRTTLDYVNSFPHLRSLGILPRVGTNALLHGMTIELFDPSSGFDKYMGWVSGHASFKELYPQYEAFVMDLAWLQTSWEAYWAYLAPWASPLEMAGKMARPSSGWHMARLALARCDKVELYGFSLKSDRFHYFDSLVQETVRPVERDPNYGITHRFAWEHEVLTRCTPAHLRARARAHSWVV